MGLMPSRKTRRLSIERLEGRQMFAVAVVPELFKDIDSGTGYSSPAQFTAAGSDTYFAAESANELWKTDGTRAGTSRVHDFGSVGANIANLTYMNGALYFSANDGTNGTELWKCVTSTGVTSMVKNINTGSGLHSAPEYLVVVNNVLFFSAMQDGHGRELWKSDGTSSGTQLVDEIRSGGNGSAPESLTVMGTDIYFSADDGTNGRELWKCDTTSLDNSLVANIHTTASTGSNPDYLTVVGTTLYFQAKDGTHGRELWKSNSSGTQIVKDIASGDSSPSFLVNLNGTLLFRAFDAGGAELWKSDGTSAGTTRVKDIYAGLSDGLSGSSYIYVINNVAYFQASDGVEGFELWRSNGTASGTFRISDINADGEDSNPTQMTFVNGLIFFSARSATTPFEINNDRELWQTDGTLAGTSRVADIRPGTTSSGPNQLFAAPSGKQLFFAADDGTVGEEFWQVIVTKPGDANLDGLVNGADYTIWSDHFKDAGTWYWQDGDFNGSTSGFEVDGADYTIWSDHFGT